MDFWKIHTLRRPYLSCPLDLGPYRYHGESSREDLPESFPDSRRRKRRKRGGKKILLILVYDRISKMPSSNLLSVKSYRYCPRYLSMAMSIKLPLPGAPFSNITRDHYLYSCVKDKEGKNLLSSKNQFCQRAPPSPLSSQDSISFPFQRRRFKVFQINISPLYPNVLPPQIFKNLSID